MDVESEVVFRGGQEETMKQTNSRIRHQLALSLTSVFILAGASQGLASITVNFTAADVKAAMGIPLNDTTSQWGLWAVRAMPVVTGGSYTLNSESTTQVGWGASAVSFGHSPYAANNDAWFFDNSGAEVAGDPANPLYMIMDRSASTFTSYFGNTVTAVSDASSFAFSFTLDAGATWTGEIQFVVDGSKYTLGTASSGAWVEDFFGGYGDDGGLAGNTGNGYTMPVPEPTTIVAGLLLLLPFGASTVRMFRKSRAA